MEASPSAGQIFSTGLIPTYTVNGVKKNNEIKPNSFVVQKMNNKPLNYPVSLNKNTILENSQTYQDVQCNQFTNLQQCNSTYNNNDTISFNNKLINEANQDTLERKINQVELFNPTKNNNQVTTSNNLKISNQSKTNDNNSQYKLEFIVKNDKYQFVKLEHVMLSSYDVSIKIMEVPTAKSPKNKDIDNRVNISKTIEIEPSLTMNIENGNITIVPDGKYTISSGITLKKMSPINNKVMNKDFSQIILLSPNKNNIQLTSQNNFLTKSLVNVPNESNIFPSSKNSFRNQCYLQKNSCKLDESSLNLKQLNKSPSITTKKGKGRILKSEKIPRKDGKKNSTTRSVQSLQGKTTTPKSKHICPPKSNNFIKNGTSNNSNNILFRPIPEKFLKPSSI
ncbi:Hypothetical protein SRAE_X000022200 [Strongyloides ratti]|uniref:Uncharacterized protein n=1 Tax=Strongyloides ratti TaxID=34506 RepID=A0A090LRS2_STRRB|nr:Hypothetical protein SRAE_X000022200 [Strongyloides ratti]CEF70892.1 Hypothetical protein SRAE_X000022200 [Strongyloides ratti]